MTEEEKALANANGWNVESIQGYAEATAILVFLLRARDKDVRPSVIEKLCDYPFTEYVHLYKRALNELHISPEWEDRLNSTMGKVNLDGHPKGKLNSYQQGIWLLAYQHELSTCYEGRMSSSEAAAILGVSDARIRQMIKEGKIPAEKVGKSWRISRSDVAEALKTMRK